MTTGHVHYMQDSSKEGVCFREVSLYQTYKKEKADRCKLIAVLLVLYDFSKYNHTINNWRPLVKFEINIKAQLVLTFTF